MFVVALSFFQVQRTSIYIRVNSMPGTVPSLCSRQSYKVQVWFCPYNRWKNWGSRSLSDLFRVLQLVKAELGFKPSLAWFENPLIFDWKGVFLFLFSFSSFFKKSLTSGRPWSSALPISAGLNSCLRYSLLFVKNCVPINLVFSGFC